MTTLKFEVTIPEPVSPTESDKIHHIRMVQYIRHTVSTYLTDFMAEIMERAGMEDVTIVEPGCLE